MRSLRKLLLAFVLAFQALGAAAQMPQPETFYLVGAAGRTQYDYDCWYWYDCANANATFGKVGAGWRFGIFGLEAWYMDFGSANVYPSPDELRMRAVAFNGVWYLPLAPQLEGLLRAGIAEVSHQRSRDVDNHTFSGTFGLGLVLTVAPAVAVEFAWDVTGGQGTYSGSATASALSVGLRVRF
jgi:hypothetical protein